MELISKEYILWFLTIYTMWVIVTIIIEFKEYKNTPVYKFPKSSQMMIMLFLHSIILIYKILEYLIY